MRDWDQPALDKMGQQEWINWTAEIKRDIYDPVFKRLGVSFGEALIIVRLARVENVMRELLGRDIAANDETNDDEGEEY